MNHDLVAFGDARISLTSIHAIVTEPHEPGTVYIDYGHGNRIGFEGDISDVMEVIDRYCEKQLAALLPPGLAGISRTDFNALVEGVH